MTEPSKTNDLANSALNLVAELQAALYYDNSGRLNPEESIAGKSAVDFLETASFLFDKYGFNPEC
jgi:hypothetical protein